MSPTSPQRDPLVVFSPSGKRGRFCQGTSVLEAARGLGVDLDSVCGGRAICGRCQVRITEGELPKHGIVSRADHVSAPGQAERHYDASGGLDSDCRLACQALLTADVAIDVPASSQVHRQVVRKPHQAHDIDIAPVVHPYYVVVAEPDMHKPCGDLQRLITALEEQWQLRGLRCALSVTQNLQGTLRQGAWEVTVAIRDGSEIIAVWPAFRERLYGIAVDVGSTTIAAHLCEIASGEVLASAGSMNPQIRFGEDLMSRVSYIMMNPGGATELTGAVRAAINKLITEVVCEASISTDEVVEMTLVANPIMQHLVLGIDPVELGTAPFALASDSACSVPASQLGIAINSGGTVYALPCIAGHVGADTAGVLLAEAPYQRDEISLIVDVGTNAEILLGNRHRLLAASSPTGPAFEGAQISCGQRAAPGAIERVRIDPDSLEPRFKIIACELWSDAEGFAEQLPECGVTGICGSGIIEAIAELFLAGVIRADGTIDADMATKSARVVNDGRTHAYVLHDGEPAVRIQQNDVRAIQLAKAALYAGARLLMERLGVERVDRIRLAGAFGAHIDVKYAMVLGMIPDCRLDQVSSAGNAAGTGACIALLDRDAREVIEQQVRKVEKVETAVETRFQEHFVAAMSIPHQSHVFEELARVVDLPAPPQQRAGANRRRRRQGSENNGVGG